MSDAIRVLIVDDQPLIRLGFAMVLDAESDIEVVGEAGDGEEGFAQSIRLRPDVVLMDVRMPRVDGVAATGRIVSALPDTRVLVLTTFDLDDYAFGALDAGAGGFLLKDVDRTALVGAVRAVARGDAVLSPRVTREVLARMTGDPGGAPSGPGTSGPTAGGSAPTAEASEDERRRIADLTPRERDVFGAIARGLTNAEIATELFLGETTVKTHVGRVLAKLGARDRIHAVIIAHRCGWTDGRPPPSEPGHRSAR
ncbi:MULTISPECIES: response regulator transcription factor [unclassified Microbacterium]|uniref:response regulator transcription factor n=1 Tax=unclassified Microbacterium TaxID=2609290 RepID=UPI00301592CA